MNKINYSLQFVLLKLIFQTLQSRRHSDELSIVKSEHLSPPNISPIYNAENNMLHEKIEHSSHLTTQLDFTMDISMDNTPLKKNQIFINEKLSAGKLTFVFAACFSYCFFFFSNFSLFCLYLTYFFFNLTEIVFTILIKNSYKYRNFPYCYTSNKEIIS